MLDGGDVVQILADDPATARRVPARLFGWFAHTIDLDDPVADDLALVYQQTDGDILALVEAIFRHDAFWSAESLAGHVKSPAEWLVGSLRLLRAKVNRKELRDVGEWLDELGQSLLDPPSVFGWDQDLAWVGTSGLLARAHVADAIGVDLVLASEAAMSRKRSPYRSLRALAEYAVEVAASEDAA